MPNEARAAIALSALYLIGFIVFLCLKKKMGPKLRLGLSIGLGVLLLVTAIIGILAFRKVFTDVDVSLATGAAIMLSLVVATLTVPTLLPKKNIVIYVAMPLGLIAFAIFLVAMIYLSKRIIQPRAFLLGVTYRL